MSNRDLPLPLRQTWNPSGPQRNPGATNPFPRPTNMPVQVWMGNREPLVWSASPDNGVVYDAAWSTPVFDLAPWLRGVSPDNEGQLAAGAKAIWTGYGTQLRVQISSPVNNGLGGLDLSGFEAEYREFGHITQVTQVSAIDATQDVSAQFTAGQESVLVIIQPKNLRYYRVVFKFRVRDDFGFPGSTGPDIYIQGAVY